MSEIQARISATVRRKCPFTGENKRKLKPQLKERKRGATICVRAAHSRLPDPRRHPPDDPSRTLG